MSLISYKNDKKLKDMFVDEVENHYKQDQIIQGTYSQGSGKNWKGCAVGCSIHSLNIKLGKRYKTDDHTVYEKELGIPKWLARLEDTIFEGLPKNKAMKLPLQFAQAVPVGVDLEPIKWKFSAYLIRENIKRVKGLKDLDEDIKKQVIDASKQVLKVHTNAIKTGEWDERAAWSAWSAAGSAAWSARSARSARSAAWSAAWSAWSAAGSAAWSARSARSAAESIESAAESAAWSARSARSAARSAAYIKHAKKLLILLRETKS